VVGHAAPCALLPRHRHHATAPPPLFTPAPFCCRATPHTTTPFAALPCRAAQPVLPNCFLPRRLHARTRAPAFAAAAARKILSGTRCQRQHVWIIRYWVLRSRLHLATCTPLPRHHHACTRTYRLCRTTIHSRDVGGWGARTGRTARRTTRVVAWRSDIAWRSNGSDGRTSNKHGRCKTSTIERKGIHCNISIHIWDNHAAVSASTYAVRAHGAPRGGCARHSDERINCCKERRREARGENARAARALPRAGFNAPPSGPGNAIS